MKKWTLAILMLPALMKATSYGATQNFLKNDTAYKLYYQFTCRPETNGEVLIIDGKNNEKHLISPLLAQEIFLQANGILKPDETFVIPFKPKNEMIDLRLSIGRQVALSKKQWYAIKRWPGFWHVIATADNQLKIVCEGWEDCPSQYELLKKDKPLFTEKDEEENN